MNGDKGYTLPKKETTKLDLLCPRCNKMLNVSFTGFGVTEVELRRPEVKERRLSRGDLEHIADDYRNKCVLQFTDFERLIAEIGRCWAVLHELQDLCDPANFYDGGSFHTRKVYEAITGKRS